MSELREDSERILADESLTFYQKASEFIVLYMHMIDQFSGDEEKNLANMLEVISGNSIAQDANELLQRQINRLLEEGVRDGVLTIDYPEETVRTLILGLLAQSRKQLLSMEQIITIIEQAMHLPAGSLKREEEYNMTQYSESLDAVVSGLQSSRKEGLTSTRAEERLREYGPNQLRAKKKKTNLQRFLEQFKDVMIIILIAAAVVSFIVACNGHETSEFLNRF